MLELLSDVLRQVLRSDQTHEITLAEEMGFLERYLAIEQVRFSDRLRVRFDVDDSLRDAAVPAFVLQPLVENALRHGIAKRADGGLVEIAAKREGDTLVLSVSDNGPGIDGQAQPAETSGNGLGLANVRERLTTMYGTGASLDLSVRSMADGGGTVATVRLPFSVPGSRFPVPTGS